MEERTQEFLQEECDWILKTRKDVQEIGSVGQEVAESFAQQGHLLYRIGPNRIRCSRCGKCKTRRQSAYWRDYACQQQATASSKTNKSLPYHEIAETTTPYGEHRLLRDNKGYRCIWCRASARVIGDLQAACVRRGNENLKTKLSPSKVTAKITERRQKQLEEM